MLLKSYLKKHKLTQEEFARTMRVSKGLIWQWLNGHTEITAERAVEIERATEGAVPREETRPDLYRRVA